MRLFAGNIKVEAHRFNAALCEIHVISIDIAEWQLLILLKIVSWLNRIDIMHPDEFENSHRRIADYMTLKMFYKIGYTQYLVPLTKSEQVDRKQRYADGASQYCEIRESCRLYVIRFTFNVQR